MLLLGLRSPEDTIGSYTKVLKLIQVTRSSRVPSVGLRSPEVTIIIQTLENTGDNLQGPV